MWRVQHQVRENPYPALRKHDFTRFVESAKKDADFTCGGDVVGQLILNHPAGIIGHPWPHVEEVTGYYRDGIRGC